MSAPHRTTQFKHHQLSSDDHGDTETCRSQPISCHHFVGRWKSFAVSLIPRPTDLLERPTSGGGGDTTDHGWPDTTGGVDSLSSLAAMHTSTPVAAVPGSESWGDHNLVAWRNRPSGSRWPAVNVCLHSVSSLRSAHCGFSWLHKLHSVRARQEPLPPSPLLEDQSANNPLPWKSLGYRRIVQKQAP